MNKVQETLTKMVFQYIKDTYPNDKILNHLMKGYEELSDENKEPEKQTRISYASPLSETLLEEKDRIKQIMDKILDNQFKPGKILYAERGIDIKKVETPEPVTEEVVAPEPIQTDTDE